MRVKIYDTTLRDGTQGERVSFSVEDKLLIARKLDELGVDYVEGGWPGSNVKDAEFFARARSLSLSRARLAAFGSTCHPRNGVGDDRNLRALLDAGTPVVTIFGKSWDLHVRKALAVALEKNLELIEASVAFLKSEGREVIYDAEHFFDGYLSDPDYAIRTLLAAERGGADCLVLCDTNGGTLTSRLREVVAEVKRRTAAQIGIHTHNDSDLAVANAIAAVECGAGHVQGTINGYGERCGNANLCSVIPLLELKLGRETVGRERLSMLSATSHFVSELANLPARDELPFVGRSAFAHKGGIHVSAVMRDPATYEHVDPELTGNSRRVLVSDLSGKSNILYKAAEMGLDVFEDGARLQTITSRIKELEHQGYQFEAADGSFKLLVESCMGRPSEFLSLKRYSVASQREGTGDPSSEATVSIELDGIEREATAEGSGPVHALDRALRRALGDDFECLAGVHLKDYKVRVLGGNQGTSSRVRVLIQMADADETWSTMGVSDNILEASLRALTDGINYKLLKDSAGRAGEVAQRGLPRETVSLRCCVRPDID